MDSIERAKEIRKTWKGTNKGFVDKVGIPARAAHDKKTKALEKHKGGMYTSPTGSKHRIGSQKHKYWEAIVKRGKDNAAHGQPND